jgi:hypothetical protein
MLFNTCPFLILCELTTHPFLFFNMKQQGMLDATPVFRSPATHKIYKCKQERKWNIYDVSFLTEN